MVSKVNPLNKLNNAIIVPHIKFLDINQDMFKIEILLVKYSTNDNLQFLIKIFS